MQYVKYFLIFIFSFFLSLLAMPLVISLGKRLKAGQPILKYVDQHKDKVGTPTMGGLGFIIPCQIVALIFASNGLSKGRIAGIATLCYAFLGFLDDFLKIKRKDNGGLTPLQKIIGQVGIASALSYYCYKTSSAYNVLIPFTNISVNFAWGIIPFSLLVFIAVTNAVNLTDGIDGLAGNTSAVYMVFFSLIIFAMWKSGRIDDSLLVFSLAVLGGLLAFLIFNSKPAKVFMGDTGSLALGGAVASLGMFSGNAFIIPILGIMFVVSCISVIIQVIVYKITKKRVFRMAPFHHHLEKCGYSEPRIVSIYVAITTVFGFISLLAVIPNL